MVLLLNTNNVHISCIAKHVAVNGVSSNISPAQVDERIHLRYFVLQGIFILEIFVCVYSRDDNLYVKNKKGIEHVPNCMRPLINRKLKLLSELTEHTLANEIEAPHEILRKK